MAGHENYLRNALSKYQYPDVAKRDILAAFQNFKDLRPNVDSFVFNDGSRKELLCLEGTIPVTYKGNTYNIPVCLWLLETHPYNPPMVFVKPTATMQIKQSNSVDSNGKVFLPYLYEWRHPNSDLLGLIQIMAIVFGENPPVFARSAAPPRPSYPPGQAPAARPPYPAGGNPPYPTSNTGANPPYPTSNTGGAQPPYPTSGTGDVQPTAGPQPGFMPMPSIGGPANPPYPGGSYPTQPYQPPSSTYQPPQGPYPPTSTPGYPSAGYPSQQTPYPAGPGSGSTYPSTGSYPATNPAYPATTTASSTTTSSANTLSDDQIRLSLLSAVEDKMRRRLKEIFAQAQAEMDALKKTQDDLQKGKTKLDELVNKLQTEKDEIDKNTRILKEKDDELKAALSKMENQDELSIDDAVDTTAPLYRQLLNSFAEEQATEDAIYYLGEALRKGVIELDVFLKQVRELSRKQFMLRALIVKCREKAGLPKITS